jgi:intracellular sulfur oxidation DsrE/DsrF family protein
MNSSSVGRRGFLAGLSAIAAAIGLPTFAHADNDVSDASEPWERQITGRQRYVFHARDPREGSAILVARTVLDTQRDSFQKRDSDTTVVIGLQGRAVALTLNDAMWAKYPVGKLLTMNSAPQQPFTRNPLSSHQTGDPDDYANGTIPELIARGVVILVCNNTLKNMAPAYLPAPVSAEQSAAFYADVKANLIAGVHVVPAMVVALGTAQERGCHYVFAG